MNRHSSPFLTTRWTQVFIAQGASSDARAALADLCSAYYPAVYAYIRHTASDLGDPRDLTQEFFARVLGRQVLIGADRAKGRFRAYLLGAVKHYLADTRDHRRAAKRGSQHEHVPLCVGTDTSPGLDCTSIEASLSDAWFDRQWGLAILDRAVAALALEHEEAGRAKQFQVLKPWLTGDGGEGTTAAAADALGLNEGAVRVAIHRLRKRFRALVKAEIAQTVSSDEEAQSELRYLIEVVS